MKASGPAEIIHMTYITTSTVKEGKVAVLMSVDNYSEYCYGIAVEMDLCLESVESKPLEQVISPTIVPLEEAEQHYLQWATTNYQGDRKALAKTLGISERTLYRKLHT